MNPLKSRIPAAAGVLLIALLSLVIFFAVSSVVQDRKDISMPIAEGGSIDLSGIAFEKTQSVALVGEWRFYWQAFHDINAMQDMQIEDSQSQLVNIPHSWVDSSFANQPSKIYGYASYRLSITVADANEPLALRVPLMGTAYVLYVNNKRLASGGEIGKTKETARPGYEPGIFVFTPPSNSFDLIVHVSNYEYYWGGMWEPIRLGNADILHQEQSKKNFKSTFIAAIFLTIAVFNLIQFSLRSQNIHPLLIAISCILLGLREIESSQILSFAGLLELSFGTNVRINFMTFYVTTLVLVVYFYINFKQEYNARIIYLICAVPIAFSISVLTSSTAQFSAYMWFFQIFVFVAMPYLIWGLLLAIKRKRNNARLLFTGTTFLFLLLVNDILTSMNIIDSVFLISFGLVAFIICLNYITYSRFIQAGVQNTHLNLVLEERNETLQSLSRSLEEKVVSRTCELANVNKKLTQLAYQDPMTKVFNRRGLLIKIEQAKAEFFESQRPFCLMLIDFDNFKTLNDRLGHETGDTVLKEGTRVMLSSIRNHDKIGRWGGEEFLILTQDTHLQIAYAIANKLRERIYCSLSDKIKEPVSVTIGVSEFSASETIEQCINRADKALYRGKESGRNCVCTAF